jgi:hypothetical protein
MQEPLERKVDYMFETEELLKKLRRAISGSGSAELRVLRSLMNAETANIRAKLYEGEEGRNYAMKRRYLREAIGGLPATGWKFYFQRTCSVCGNYVVYVILPGGLQVSWHGRNCEKDMEGVPEEYEIKWDGVQGVTLERLVQCAQALLGEAA